MKKIVVIIILIHSISSCKTIGIQKQTYNQVEIATIGITENKLTNKQFNTNAIPKLIDKIRLDINLNNFNKSSFKSFKEANKQLNKSTNLKYIDSLENKPKYIKLSILDKVSLLNNLNSKENTSTFNYLKTAIKPNIVTELSLVFSDNLQFQIQSAEEIYLIQNKYKKYALELIFNKDRQIITFSKATIFDYKTSNFCWGQNNKHQLVILDIGSQCNKNTFKTYQKAKKDNSFNFIKL